MYEVKFRSLNADEIQVRPDYNDKGNCSEVHLLLYKDSRTDMNIFDEVFGKDGWESTVSDPFVTGAGSGLVAVRCTVTAYINGKKISHTDYGNARMGGYDPLKSASSDALKRVGFLFGIGRELYDPDVRIVLPANSQQDYEKKMSDRYYVSYFNASKGKIKGLTVKNLVSDSVVYTYGDSKDMIAIPSGSTGRTAASKTSEDKAENKTDNNTEDAVGSGKAFASSGLPLPAPFNPTDVASDKGSGDDKIAMAAPAKDGDKASAPAEAVKATKKQLSDVSGYMKMYIQGLTEPITEERLLACLQQKFKFSDMNELSSEKAETIEMYLKKQIKNNQNKHKAEQQAAS